MIAKRSFKNFISKFPLRKVSSIFIVLGLIFCVYFKVKKYNSVQSISYAITFTTTPPIKGDANQEKIIKYIYELEIEKNINKSINNFVTNSSIEIDGNRSNCYLDSFFEVDNLHILSLQTLSSYFERYITTLQCFCEEAKRIGNIAYGGFRICADENVRPSPGCLVYSYQHELSAKFTSHIGLKYNCSVIPTVKELPSYMKFNKTIQNVDVFILKIDRKDFPFLFDFFKSIRNYNIRQIIIEIRFTGQNETKSDYINLLKGLITLKQSQCGIYWYERNWEFVKDEEMTSRGRVNCFTVNWLCEKLKSTFRNERHGFTETMLLVPGPKGLAQIGRGNDLKNLAIFVKYVSTLQIFCQKVRRIGRIVDGGWDICDDAKFRPKSPCIVYSFGINYDFSFDKDMEKTYGCDVYAFDPSMKSGNYNQNKHIHFYGIGLGDKAAVNHFNWTLKPMNTIKEELGHKNRRIDVLKMDIEGDEKQSLAEMIASGSLKNVVQLCVEFHSYYDVHTVRKLYEIGFRIFWSHQNPGAPLYTKDETFSYGNEVSFVNINAT